VGRVQVVLTVVPRKQMGGVRAIIHEFDADAFYSVDDIQSAARGVFPGAKRNMSRMLPSVLRPGRGLLKTARE
jgi:hypothetical protein